MAHRMRTLTVVLVSLAAGSLVPGAAPSGVAAGGVTATHPVVFRMTDATHSSCSLEALLDRHDLVLDETLIASRQLYRVHGESPPFPAGRKGAEQVIKRLRDDTCVGFAEADAAIALNDDQFHSWTPDGPTPTDEDEWRAQPAVTLLDLDAAHDREDGDGALVAVLDTGVDAGHEALAGSVEPGWDYVDDDATPLDAACGCDSDGDGVRDSAVGHGTFVAGMVSLVAPAARILPLRVLDGDGQGTVFAVAQAILDAVAAGADVINLSFGTDKDADSKVVSEALRTARDADVIVVAAAGNQGSKRERFPANNKEVWAVAALDPSNQRLAAFSNRGGWVDLATTGERIVGPLPGNDYAWWSGTSVAAPLVAGQAALLKSATVSAPVKKLTGWVEQTARKLHGVDIRRGRVEIVASLIKAATDRRGRIRAGRGATSD